MMSEEDITADTFSRFEFKLFNLLKEMLQFK